MIKRVYADNAATSALTQIAFEAMLPYLKNEYGNPSAIYSFGRNAKMAVESAREKVANAIGAHADEIYFTSGGTESDNWAIRSAAKLFKEKGKHIISSCIEHHAVLHTLKELENEGFEVTYLKVDEYGQISLDDLRSVIRSDTILITIMTANNEVGTILPTKEIGEIARNNNIAFHTDAVQAAGHIPIDVQSMSIDMLSLSGHKFGGPKGTGVLYIKNGIGIPSNMFGGGQEHSLRSGTENVAGIVGLATALEDATNNLQSNMQKVSLLRDKLIEGLLKIPNVSLTGDSINRLPGIASFIIECVEGESLVIMLDRNGICASSGSACSSGSQEPSHVLLATGIPRRLAHSSLRLSLNEQNTEEDIDYILEKLPPIIDRIRQLSPQWNERIK